ncbi:MAG: tryptophan--tRNA ligase [Oligoflexia bacterium]|nr:tryptophan--tRNA ligase [Oligoflexia bacterium]
MSKKKIILTGIKPTGTLHLGNYLGAIKPGLELSSQEDTFSFFFIADYHGLTQIQDKKILNERIYDVAAAWLAFGLNTDKIIFYRQSDIPEIIELSWILACLTSKGLMNRAHAYKAIVADNEKNGRDTDDGINIGTYTYPVLMAADILAFDTDLVPVGKDQIQHVEIARDIAESFNNRYKKTFNLPQSFIRDNAAIIPGLDGRKMSKSYDNIIPLFAPADNIKKLVARIKTDSSGPNEPKDPNTSSIFQIFSVFADEERTQNFRSAFLQGISWGDAKEALSNLLKEFLHDPREKYLYYTNHRDEIDSILREGAEKARPLAYRTLKRARQTIGIQS